MPIVFLFLFFHYCFSVLLNETISYQLSSNLLLDVEVCRIISVTKP